MLHIISLSFHNISYIPSSPMCVSYPDEHQNIFHPEPNIFSLKPCDLTKDLTRTPTPSNFVTPTVLV